MDLDLILNNPDNGKLIIAAGLGALIGLERELSGKDPSLRTFCLICLGSCLFSIISQSMRAEFETFVDPGRIAAQIVVGIGFLGAGTIYRSRNGVNGLTTAALMWVSAAIGMAIGFGHEATAISVTVLVLASMTLLNRVHRIIHYFRQTKSNENQD